MLTGSNSNAGSFGPDFGQMGVGGGNMPSR